MSPDAFETEEMFVERHLESLGYDAWVDAMILVKSLPVSEHAAALTVSDVHPAAFERATRHWTAVLSDEIARGDFTRTRAFGVRFATAPSEEPEPETTRFVRCGSMRA